ncbi:hypothetical protein NDN08_005945 [Rhodosorus marinus]|uniref:Cell division control protein 45 homolog n=1 Tax=Rhodosorus marinus TaxID=101924 RepID=A0AAV8UJA9_9RHOD|nr:hypothetical protein NDN08_005945 [Rhodosorus marinus]
MIVSLRNLVDCWSEVVRSREEASGPVLLFVALDDCDAIATAMSVMALLKADLVRYEVVPVVDLGQLADRFKEMAKPAEPRSAVFINCGARVDLEKLLSLETVEDEALKVFVLDSCRPFHLNNIESTRVQLFDDALQPVDQSSLPLCGYEDAYGFVEVEMEDESAGSDVEAEDDVVFGSDIEYESDANEVDGTNDRSKKRHSSRKKEKTKKRARQNVEVDSDMRHRAYDYYSSCHVATPSALVCYLLSMDLKKENPTLLWLATVGIADHFIFGKSTNESYEESASLLKGQLERFYNEQEAQTGSKQYENNSQSLSSSLDAEEVIQHVDEPRLELLRHWNLFDAVLYSTYMCSKLSTWRQTGRRRVLEFLATLGIPIRVAQQRWQHLSRESRNVLEDPSLETTLGRLGLNDFHRDGFVKTKGGYKASVSAVDVVLAVASTLEVDNPEGRHNVPGENVWESLFWKAYDILGAGLGDVTLERGMDLASRMQMLLVQVGGQVIDQRAFVSSGTFRYAVLRDGQYQEAVRHPLVITRLAHFLMDALEAQGEKPKPFVIIAPLTEKSTWLAVAVTRASTYNDFGLRFRTAAAKNGTKIVDHGFCPHIVEVADGQETEFVRFLHDVMG